MREENVIAYERTRGRYMFCGGTAKSTLNELQSSLEGQVKQKGQEYEEILDKLVGLDSNCPTRPVLHSIAKIRTRHARAHEVKSRAHEIWEWVKSTEEHIQNPVSPGRFVDISLNSLRNVGRCCAKCGKGEWEIAMYRT